MRSNYISFLSAPSAEPAKTLAPELLRQVIQEAGKTFIDGYKNNKKFKEDIKNNAELQTKVHNFFNKSFPQFKDECFQDLDANRIEGTNFIAAAGPDHSDMPRLIENTVYNSRLPIRHIFALGQQLTHDDDDSPSHSFYDYCVYAREETFENYKTTIQNIDGEYSITPTSKSKIGSCSPENVVRSLVRTSKIHDIKQEEKQLHVTVMNLADNTALDIDYYGSEEIRICDPETYADNKKFYDERKEALWQLYQTSLREPVLIHCTAGLGRTGHVIFTLELLKHYDRVFGSNNPQTIATEIHAILNRIRRNRPGLLLTYPQFEMAIRNAVSLRQYKLKMDNDLRYVFSEQQSLATTLNVDPKGSVNVIFTPTLFTIQSNVCHFYQRPAEVTKAIDDNFRQIQQGEAKQHPSKIDGVLHGIRMGRDNILQALTKKNEKTFVCEIGVKENRISCYREGKVDTVSVFDNAEYFSEIFGENNIDAIFSAGAYLNFSDRVGSLVEAYKALKSGGVLMIEQFPMPGCAAYAKKILEYLGRQGYNLVGEPYEDGIRNLIIQKTPDKPELQIPVLFHRLLDNSTLYQPSRSLINSLNLHIDTFLYHEGAKQVRSELCKDSQEILEKCENLTTLVSLPRYQALSCVEQYYLILLLTYKNNPDPTSLIERFDKLHCTKQFSSDPGMLFCFANDPAFSKDYYFNEQIALIEFTAYKNIISLGYTYHTASTLNKMGIPFVRERLSMPESKLNFSFDSNNVFRFR